MVTIRRARAADVPDVLAFLEAHWKPGHVFTRDRALFDWQHEMRDRPGEYSMAIARRDSDGVLLGVLGFIATRQLDPALSADNTVWLALWKVRDDSGEAGLGLRLVRAVLDGEPHTTAGVLGFQPDVRAIYRALGFLTGELRHYVLRNPDIERCELAAFGGRRASPPDRGGLTAVPLDESNVVSIAARLDVGARAEQVPRKTAGYFRERYLRHPVYRYRCFALLDRATPIGLYSSRIAEHAGRRALRLVDYLGAADAVPRLGGAVLDDLRRTGAEYADLYNEGIGPELFARAGFALVDPDGGDIVPDHFEPFERRNVRIAFAIKADRPFVIFKGDADQDRPNVAIAS